MSIEIGAIKIKDGFFIGDVYAARDIEFVILNKITRIVNCAAAEVPNVFACQGVMYFPFEWLDVTEQQFEKRDIDRAIDFLNMSIELGESILIHSVRCQNRAVFMCCCYLIKQMRWTANTAIDFVYSRKNMPRLRPQLQQQLSQYETLQRRDNQQLRNIEWTADFIRMNMVTLTDEQIILANTFLNTYIETNPKAERKNATGTKIQWNDRTALPNRSGAKAKLCTSFIPAFEQMQFGKINQNQQFIRPILKGTESYTKKQENVALMRANSANSLLRFSKIREQSLKKSKIVKNKQNQLLQCFNIVKRCSLQQKKPLRPSSKDRNYDNMISSVKYKQNNIYLKLGDLMQTKKNYKPIKKMASTKMVRPHSGNTNYGVHQVRSFMEGLFKLNKQNE